MWWSFWLACSGDPAGSGRDRTPTVGSTTSGPVIPPTPDPTPPTSEGNHALPPPSAPNVVLILVDDMGWTGPSSGRLNKGYASDFYQTPTIDALAEQGVAFDTAYAAPVCQAGRALVLTGQVAQRTKVYTNGNSNERADETLRAYDVPFYWETLQTDSVTIAEMLGDHGWETASFGKWHLGEVGTQGPEEQGFQWNVAGTSEGVVTGGSDGHFAHGDGSWDLPNLPANDVPLQFMADRLTDEAIAWFSPTTDAPRFAFLPYFSVHQPIQAPDVDLDVFEGLEPGVLHTDPVYAAMQYNLDRNIGRLVAHLEATDDPRNPGATLMDNTLFIVASDNGGQGGLDDEGVYTGREYTNNLPLFSGKSTTWEGGVRIPMVIRWDRGFQQGRIVTDIVSLADLVPTILEIADVPAPTGVELDGRSLRPFLVDEIPAWTRDVLYLYYPAYMESAVGPGVSEIRENPTAVAWNGTYKLIYDWGKRADALDAAWHLYDLSTDIGEANDLAAVDTDRVSKMGTSLVSWLESTGADPLLDKETGAPIPWPDPSVLGG